MVKPHQRLQSSKPTLTSLALLLALTLVPSEPIASLVARPAQAQSPDVSFPIPAELADGSFVQIDGSSSMEKINEALKQRFAERFPNNPVDLAYSGTDSALEKLRNGTIDLAAIGRPLTEAEKAQGFVAVPINRDKIAMIVGPNNPFTGSLTDEQFAQIFRGEITDWSEVGGPAGAIQLIDRPENSDTRQAFRNYPVFKNAPFEAAANAVKLSDDTTDAVVEALGNDGIGYAVADQVIDRSDVRIVSMHKTPVTDARYPFSQPLLYVYKDPNPSPAVQAFLGYTVNSANATALAKPAEKPVDSAAVVTASPAVPAPTGGSSASVAETVPAAAVAAPVASRLPWWPWWLSIPLLGALLWWLLKDRGSDVAIAPAAIASEQSRIVLTPRNCKATYAYWEVPEAVKADFRQQGGQRLMVRVYDVTDIDMNRQTPHSFEQFNCDETAQDLHLPIPMDNRDYIAELGYLTASGNWLKIARSTSVRVPACHPVTNGVNGAEPAWVGTSATHPVQTLVTEPVEQATATTKDAVPVGAAIATGVALAAGGLGHALDRTSPNGIDRVEVQDELVVDSRQHCFCVDPASMTKLQQETAVSKVLQPGTYAIKLKSGAFDYRAESGHPGEPWVLLWLYGGKVVNRKTGVEVGATWSSLNGHGDTLTLDVKEPTTLCAFFLDTHLHDNEGEVTVTVEGENQIEDLTVHSQRNCYYIDPESMRTLEKEASVSKILQPGTYTIRIKDGVFNYRSNAGHPGEPLVLLWIYGGKVVNRKTGVEVGATWSSLNGYDDVLTLDVREAATLSAFFFDTHVYDNDGKVVLSLTRS